MVPIDDKEATRIMSTGRPSVGEHASQLNDHFVFVENEEEQRADEEPEVLDFVLDVQENLPSFGSLASTTEKQNKRSSSLGHLKFRSPFIRMGNSKFKTMQTQPPDNKLEQQRDKSVASIDDQRRARYDSQQQEVSQPILKTDPAEPEMPFLDIKKQDDSVNESEMAYLQASELIRAKFEQAKAELKPTGLGMCYVRFQT